MCLADILNAQEMYHLMDFPRLNTKIAVLPAPDLTATYDPCFNLASVRLMPIMLSGPAAVSLQSRVTTRGGKSIDCRLIPSFDRLCWRVPYLFSFNAIAVNLLTGYWGIFRKN